MALCVIPQDLYPVKTLPYPVVRSDGLAPGQRVPVAGKRPRERGERVPRHGYDDPSVESRSSIR